MEINHVNVSKETEPKTQHHQRYQQHTKYHYFPINIYKKLDNDSDMVIENAKTIAPKI